MEHDNTWTHAAGSEAGLPGSRRGFVSRERRKVGRELRLAPLPLSEATLRRRREPQEILPTVHRHGSARGNTHRRLHFTYKIAQRLFNKLCRAAISLISASEI